jgi:hypothetical protein
VRRWLFLASLAVASVLVLTGFAQPNPPPAPNSPPSTPPDSVVAAATQAAAGQLGVTADEVVVVASEQRDWPDSSLGCPEPGRAYAQIITPGYRVTIDTADGASEVQVHTNLDGSRAVLC